MYIYISEGSLEVKLPTIWIDEKQRWKGSERRGVEERRSEKRKSQKKEDADVRKGRKVAKHCVFPMICGFGRSKSRLAKAAGAEPSGQMRDEKLHAVVARSTFRSQNVQNTPCSDHFWEKVHAVVARSTFPSQNVKSTRVRTTFGRWDVVPHGRCEGLWILSKVSKTWGFYSIFKYNQHYTTLHSNTLQLQLHLHYITLHYTPLHYIQLYSNTLNYATLHCTSLCYTALHYTTFRYITIHYTPLHSSTLHSTKLHYIPLHYTTLTTTQTATTTTTTTILHLH